MKNYGELIFKNNEWIITRLEAHAVIKLKDLFRSINIVGRVPFVFKNNEDCIRDLHWFMQRYPLDMTEKARNMLKIKIFTYDKSKKRLDEILSEEYKPSLVFDFKRNKKMRIYQEKVVGLLLNLKKKSLLLGDGLGLGKTVSGIGSILAFKNKRAIVVVPTHLAFHWEEKLKEFTWLKSHIVKKTKPYKLPNVDVIIMKYSALAGWSSTFPELKFHTVIFDEVHNLRRAESKRYEGAVILTEFAEVKLGLSATPIFNYGNEIFNILDVLNKNCLGEKSSFLREWTSDLEKKIKDPKALGSYLVDNYLFLRRSPEDVGRELPLINKIIQNVDFDEKTVRNAEALMKELAIKVLDGSFSEKGQAARQLDIMVRKMTGISKAKAVAEYVKILIDNGRPVLLAGYHRDVYEIWKKSFKDYNPLFYTGSESVIQKRLCADRFIAGDSKLMIISIASGEGLDGLQACCKDIVLGELAWTPAVHDQLIGRLNRDGQKNQVTAHFLVSASGSDPLMIELLGMKASQSKSIIDPNKGVSKIASDKSRMKMLAEDILKKKAL